MCITTIGRPPNPNTSLQWRHNGLDSVSSHQPHDCLLNRSFGRRSKKTSKLRVTGLCVGNSPVTGEFPAQMASNAVFPFDDVIMILFMNVCHQLYQRYQDKNHIHVTCFNTPSTFIWKCRLENGGQFCLGLNVLTCTDPPWCTDPSGTGNWQHYTFPCSGLRLLDSHHLIPVLWT